MMNRWRIALQILTILPIPSPKKMKLRYIGEGLRYFTLIGLGLGLILAGVVYWGEKVLPDLVVRAFLPLFLAILAGGSHLDGLMDTADGLGSRRDRQRMLEIMKDSRVGAYAVMFGCSILLMKFTLFLCLPAAFTYILLVLTPAFGRWAIAFSACLFPYARPEGLGKPFADYSGWREFFWATLLLLLPTVYFLHKTGLFIFAGVAICILLLNVWLMRKLGGLTGDTYGAACEMAEVLFLIFAIACLS